MLLATLCLEEAWYLLHRGTGGLGLAREYPVLEEKPIPCPGCVTDRDTRMLEVSRGGVSYLEGTVVLLAVAPAGLGSRLCVSPPGSSLSVSERYKKLLRDIYNIVQMVERKKNTIRRWPYFWCSRWQVQFLELGGLHLHLLVLVSFWFGCVQFFLWCSFFSHRILARILK